VTGSNRTAFKQHAYSVFAASRRERPSDDDIPESVRRPMSAANLGPSPDRPERPLGGASLGLTEPKESRVAPVRQVVEALAKPVAPSAEAASRSGPSSPPSASPTHEEIRARAYELFLARKGHPGDPVADWLQAEAELRRERAPG
jgi:hypothetical protein